ncbi:hypothetical protein BDD12DRAFT_884715 [Trichophaea hybrida]|nr:hypothetical protein BDD12DRAFT_884715 [Trichophaea hybrida]
MVQRLARIADGYPVFLAARSPARADWGEVVKKCGLEFEDDVVGGGGGEGRAGQGEYPVSTERAGTVGRWVREGWGGVVPGGRKKKRGVVGVKEEEEGRSRIEVLGVA